MGKVAKVLILAAVLVAVAAAAVMAQTTGASSGVSKQCYHITCHGSAAKETIYERIGDRKSDRIYGYGNNDRLHANTYSKDTDKVHASGGGTNYLYVNDGDTLDGAIGGPGFDHCYVDATVEASDTCDKVSVR
jgi:opacity protein-like surface antigen